MVLESDYQKDKKAQDQGFLDIWHSNKANVCVTVARNSKQRNAKKVWEKDATDSLRKLTQDMESLPRS